MGSGSSAPAVDVVSHDSLHQAMGPLRQRMNELLEFSIRELSIQDLVKLSDPNHCKNYVVMMAAQIGQHFHELRVLPATDRRGVLFFREAKDLTTGLRDQAKREKDSLCFQIAYFYVRIFQIYGALALSLVDDIRTLSRSYPGFGAPQNTRRLANPNDPSSGLLAPGFRDYLRGGMLSTQIAPPGALDAFEWVRPFLRNTGRDSMGRYRALDELSKTVLFKLEAGQYRKTGELSTSAASSDLTVSHSYRRGVFYVEYGQRVIQVAMVARETETQRSRLSYDCHVVQLRYMPTGRSAREITIRREREDDPILDEKLPAGRSHFTVTRQEVPASDSSSRTETQYVVQHMLIQEFLLQWFQDFIQTIPDLLGASEEDIYRSTDRNRDYGYGDRRSSNTVDPTRAGPLSIQPTLRLLQDTERRPRAHCVARALQLLNGPPYGPRAASSIFKIRWVDLGGNRMSSDGLPELGASLRSSPGLAATDILFYDVIRDSQLIRGQDATYLQWMRQLGQLFHAPATVTNEQLQRDGLSMLRDERIPSAFRGKDVAMSDAVARQLLAGPIKDLFKRQWAHAVACDRLLAQLFLVEFDPGRHVNRIRLHPMLLTNGLVAVEQIAVQARNLLTAYYVDCEQKYAEGVRMILTNPDTTSTASTTASATATSSSSRPTTTAYPTTSYPTTSYPTAPPAPLYAPPLARQPSLGPTPSNGYYPPPSYGNYGISGGNARGGNARKTQKARRR